MVADFHQISHLFCCPDDRASLIPSSDHFSCSYCSRQFPLYDKNIAEILPKEPAKLSPRASQTYRQDYHCAFTTNFFLSDASIAWGAEESTTETWAKKRHRQVEAVRPLVAEDVNSSDAVLCDFSAGAGYYTLSYASIFRTVIHCDLSVDNLSYAWRKSRQLGLQNIVFLRMDYFAPPFRQSLDRILCMDSIIRGDGHDSRLLSTIRGSLKDSGFAVVDIHNWWHNPLRRLGLLPENFSDNQSYRKAQAVRLLFEAGIEKQECYAFYQELSTGSRLSPLIARFLPPTRFLFRIYSSNIYSAHPNDEGFEARTAQSGAAIG